MGPHSRGPNEFVAEYLTIFSELANLSTPQPLIDLLTSSHIWSALYHGPSAQVVPGKIDSLRVWRNAVMYARPCKLSQGTQCGQNVIIQNLSQYATRYLKADRRVKYSSTSVWLVIGTADDCTVIALLFTIGYSMVIGRSRLSGAVSGTS